MDSIFLHKYVITLIWPIVCTQAKESCQKIHPEGSELQTEPESEVEEETDSHQSVSNVSCVRTYVQDLLLSPLTTPSQTSAGSLWLHNSCNYTGNGPQGGRRARGGC